MVMYMPDRCLHFSGPQVEWGYFVDPAAVDWLPPEAEERWLPKKQVVRRKPKSVEGLSWTEVIAVGVTTAVIVWFWLSIFSTTQ